MREREKVIKGLECWLNDDTDCPDDDCPYMGPLICDQTAILNDAITILKAQDFPETNIGKWISVKDGLPESAGLKVLVAAKSDESVIQTMAVFTAFLGYGDWKWYTQDVGFMKNAKLRDNEIHPCWTITHWMLPPEPPKEES